ncbi:MAG TPA: hypothetical protein VJN96_04405 [Vicinamibacterales bacterium]|nr:hypothetical protein [Vicinamibacterales bacterium]
MSAPTSGSEHVRRNIRFTETLLLAAAPMVGAALTFAYEAGFIGWFGVPYTFVRIDATTILVAATAAGALLASALGYARLIPMMPWRPVFATVYLIVLPVVLLLGAFVSVATATWQPWWKVAWHVVLAITLLAAAYYTTKDFLVRPIRDYSQEGDWGKRLVRRMLEAGAGKDANLEQAFHTGVREKLGSGATGLLLLLIFGVLLMNWWGRYRAAHEKVHVLLQTPSPCVVIRRYGEGLLCVAVDTSSWQVLSNFRMVPFVPTTDLRTVMSGQLKEVTLR